MITRRNIRVKVMQLLYSIDATNETTAFKNPVTTLDKKFDKTRELFIFLLYNTLSVAQYAEKDARFRAAKNIPSHEDLNVNTKISGNQLLWNILENAEYKVAIESYRTDIVSDVDITRKLYTLLAETEDYKKYISIQSREKKDEVDILNFIFNNILLQSDLFVSSAEDRFDNWDDDAEMIQGLLSTYLHKQTNLSMNSMLDADKWNFAKELLTTCLDKKEHLLELVTPKFKNWDADRIASLDMILLQMGLSELLYFETIPTKVTINEYIDIAKEYSTPQSGQFVNGILDNLHKELLEKGRINKVAYKKVQH
jgi:N utilization substance protein B